VRLDALREASHFDNCSRAARSCVPNGASGEAGVGLERALARSRAAATTVTCDDVVGIFTFDGNQVRVSAICSLVVPWIQTRWHR
jgi:hypothetical protein